ncbi:MAG: stage II sporulation protein M [Gammaproteobacteria bacterium]|nr:stage II sporulation protein M [Gammaproteobacteria bacterium]
MRQGRFESENGPLWSELLGLLDKLEKPRYWRAPNPEHADRLPWLYRRICNHYALSRSRRYSPALVAQLHNLVMRGHQQLYRRQSAWLWRMIVFIGAGFPRTVRRYSAYFWFATVLFIGPGLLLGVYCYANPELIYSVLDQSQVANVESMYDPANRKPGRGADRQSETDFIMFGFYISNNIGIGFRTFASGILLGLGTILLLLFNGVVIGGIAGHLTRIGYHDTFWTFVSGHGAFELTAIVICGAAGLMLGRAVVAPGQYSRTNALKKIAPHALQLMMGAALMLVVAAFIEAFWSSSGVAGTVKYAVAGLLWFSVILYLARTGRHGSG